jgi:hypothetical protein
MNRLTKALDAIDHSIDSRLPQTPEAIRRRRNRILRPVAAVALAGVVWGIGSSFEGPTFSESTTTYTVNEGEGLLDAVNEIDNINSIDSRDAVQYVEELPENQEVLEDGLQVHETVTIPLGVKD